MEIGGNQGEMQLEGGVAEGRFHRCRMLNMILSRDRLTDRVTYSNAHVTKNLNVALRNLLARERERKVFKERDQTLLMTVRTTMLT